MQDIQGRYEKVLSAAREVGQEHILRFWDELSEAERVGLLDQLEVLDFHRIDSLVKTNVVKAAPFELPECIEPAPCHPSTPKNDEQANLYDRAWQIGERAICDGKVCAFTVAGGMGTRLGFDGPKGTYRIGPVTGKTLFQLFAEYIGNCRKRYGADIRWYIMTSQANHAETLEFFEENAYFGLPAAAVVCFQQGMMPAFGADGKMLLDSKGSLALSPDGHGGSLRALRKSGAIDRMKADGVEYISYFQVDNPLVRCIDPHFVGLHILAGSEMSSKSLPKAEDKEKVGNFVIGDGRVMVIEYSDFPDDLAEAKNADKTRMFDAGSIAIHVISRAFVERITEGDLQLPYHRAEKKVAFVNDAGQRVEPETSNGVKLEQFVFDAVPLAENSIVVQTVRAEEFSPVKNATGVDSAESSRRDMIARTARWLDAAGISIGQGSVVEVSPLRAIFPDDLSK